MSGPLSLDNLVALTADGVRTQVVTTFTQQVQASPSVQSAFFANATPPAVAPQNTDWVDGVATALVCSSIAHTSMYSFAGTVNGATADAYWQGQLDGPNGLAAGQWLFDWAFPTYCTDGTNTFALYLADAANWGAQLADDMSSAPTINTWVNKIIGSDPNWLANLNLVFYKLHRLDPNQEQRTVSAWAAAYPQAIEQWQSYNYVPSSTFTSTSFLGDVNSAIGVGVPGQVCSTGGLGVPICDTWTDYGGAVISFLGGRPSQMGLATGNDPGAHIDDAGGGGGGGCFVSGTPLHLHDGTTIPIETVRDGNLVLGRHGQAGTHTDEQVVVELDRRLPVYGFNDDEPFFSPGHAFWTDDGWKAFEPKITRAENPWREVSRLELGDVVHRLVSHDPLEYEKVEITSLTGRLAEAGERLYGLHLHGTASYHANGYLVAMNYPVITEKRLADGFATLTEPEREWLAARFAAVMPLLRKSMGLWLEEPLLRAIRGS